MTTKNVNGCWDCNHPIDRHSSEYPGWDKRAANYEPDKQPGTGCLVKGCTCRRWFEVV